MFKEVLQDMGIHTLDPLSVNHYYTHIYRKAIVNADVELDDISITGLKSFDEKSIVVRIDGLSVTFEFRIPKLVLNFEYKIKGKVAAIIPFHPSGDACAEFTGVRVSGTATLGILDKGFFSIKDFKTKFTIGQSKMILNGILGDGALNSLMNWVLSKISNTVIRRHIDKVSNKISAFILKRGSKVLKDIKLSDLIGNLISLNCD